MEQTTTTDQAVSTITAPGDFIDDQLNKEASAAVTRYVVVDINRNHYGMSTDSTVELMGGAMTQVTRVPHSPKYISGVLNHRGTIIPVIDMRSLFGFEPREAETQRLSQMFQTLKSDHVEWLNALQDAIFTDTAFTKATDPTQCNFGKWYETVLDGSSTLGMLIADDPILKSLIERFDSPHKKIHSIAEQVLALKSEGKVEEAMTRISSVKETELVEMCSLFDQILAVVESKLESMLVITEIGSRKAAVAVDGVSFVVDCNNDSIESLPDTAENTEFLSGLVHQPNGSYILIADLKHIYNTACPA